MGLSARDKQAINRLITTCDQVRQGTTITLGQEPIANRVSRRNRALEDYEFFCQTYFPHYCSVPNASFHNRLAKKVAQDATIRAVVEWFRGAAKSVHISIILPMWLKARGETRCMVLVGTNKESAIKLVNSLQNELANNARYNRDFGPQYNPATWGEGEFVTRDGFACYAFGLQQSPRGVRHKQYRPDLIICDDLDNELWVYNESRVASFENKLMTALLGTAQGGLVRFLIAGNRIHPNSLIARISQRKGVWHHRVNILDDKGGITWKGMYTMKQIKKLVFDMGQRQFQQEYMNNPELKGPIFSKDYFRYEEAPGFGACDGTLAFIDPTWKGNREGDFKAVVVISWKGQAKDRRFYVRKIFLRKASELEMISWCYKTFRELSEQTAIKFYLEYDFGQETKLEEFEKAGEQMGYRLPIQVARVRRPAKYKRIMGLETPFIQGRIIFDEGLRNTTELMELENQLLNYVPRSRRHHDDGPDCLEQAMYTSLRLSSSGILVSSTKGSRKTLFKNRNRHNV